MQDSDFLKNATFYLKTKDYFLTQQEFELYKNHELDMLITQPFPKNLDTYYQSENYISHSDSNQSFLDKIYQFVKNYSLKRKLKLINSFDLEAKTILDIGAGTGDFLKVCKENGWQVFGTEPNEIARQNASQKQIDLQISVADFKNQQFNVITLWHVLEHVTNLTQTIQDISELLKPNGKLIIAVPNYKSYDAEYYQKFWAAYDSPRHLWHFSKKSISKLFSKENIVVEKIQPMYFDAFYVSLLSEKYKNGKSNFLTAFYQGLRSNVKASSSGEYSSLIYVLKKQ